MRLITSILIAAILGLATAGCGDDGGGSSSTGKPTDRAFVNNMIPHHEGAISMAELAPGRAERPEIQRLARDIRRSQQGEIDVLRTVRSDLNKEGDGVVADIGPGADHETSATDLDMLREASDFDRMFIEMMIPHHRSAIDMAAVELRDGEDPRLEKLARSITDAQKREIKQMETWFADWYGEDPPQEDSGEHHG
jgi:uncharacterized protein (DUF305 family)